jgi:two-component system sensor histidine kinase AtoS
LAVVAAAGFTLASLLTWRMTRNLNRLTTAAEAIARGDLDRTVEPAGHDEVGRLTHAFNTMTESLRRTLGELSQRQALAAVGQFASSLAHEVRNPLTSMKLNLQRIQEELPDEEEVQDPIRRALSQIERLDGTVNGALSIARSCRIELRPVDLYKPLTAALHAAEPLFHAAGVTVEQPEPGPIPLMVAGDTSALERLFLNLLLNAAEALDQGGRAGVTVERSDGDALVTVWDTGTGIASEDLDKVIDAFYTTKPEGTGLGLPIAHRIAVAHGGSLDVESTPGVRTAVHMRIPLTLDVESSATRTEPPA